MFGCYPQRVELPEPTPDARVDRAVHRFLTDRDDYRPDLRMVVRAEEDWNA